MTMIATPVSLSSLTLDETAPTPLTNSSDTIIIPASSSSPPLPSSPPPPPPAAAVQERGRTGPSSAAVSHPRERSSDRGMTGEKKGGGGLLGKVMRAMSRDRYAQNGTFISHASTHVSVAHQDAPGEGRRMARRGVEAARNGIEWNGY